VEFDARPNIQILRLTMMETLTVDAEGKIVIPSEVIQKRGLHPGDELTLVESAEGLLVTRAASIKKLWRGGTDLTTGSGCSQKIMLYATRI